MCVKQTNCLNSLRSLRMELTQQNVIKQVWYRIGFPKEGGIYELDNPESNESHYAYFDNDFKLWLQGYTNKELAKEHAVDWLLLSHSDKIKNLNKVSSAWQKLSWTEIN